MHDTLLLFGATGDLAQRYLFPSLLRLQGDGLLPEDFRVRALALSPHDTEKFRGILRERFASLPHYSPTAEQVEQFLARVDYRSVDMRTPASVAEAVGDLVDRRCVSYLSIPPGLYISTCKAPAWLGGALKAPNRLMLEKPIGADLDSAREINATIGGLIDEDRIFRIDHYLGKAAVQNLLALRFGNTLLEAVWNRTYIDSVNILVSETEGVDGRNSYYARSGALRDMVQSHILQLLCLVAMEPPASLAADRIRDEKVKVLRALRPFSASEAKRHSVRGRYIAGTIDGDAVQAYTPPDDSDVETFVGVTAHIDNWRWAGVPFHLVTGKRMAERSTVVTVTLKPVSHWLFERPDGAHHAAPNRLTFRLQPQEDIELGLMSSLGRPGMGHAGTAAAGTGTVLGNRPEPPHRLRTPVPGRAARQPRPVRAQRRGRGRSAWIDSVVDGWKRGDAPLQYYPAGTWGPREAAAYLPAQFDAVGHPVGRGG